MNVGRHSRSSSSFTRARPRSSARAITPGRFESTLRIGDQRELQAAPRLLRRRQQILLRGERDLAQVVDGADVIGGQPVLGEYAAVVRGKRQHAVAKEAMQLAALQRAGGLPIERLPAVGKR